MTTRGKGAASLLSAAALAIALAAAPTASAVPVTTTIAPATPTGSTCFPFAIGTTSGTGWTPYAAWIYKNIPAFSVQAGDVIAFDSDSPNASGQKAQLQIDAATTTVNGGDVPAAPFAQLVSNSTPTATTGDAAIGNFDLKFTITGPYTFPGGGLILRFSNTAGPFATDTTCAGGTTAGAAGDPSGFFVKRAYEDADGTAPWVSQDGVFFSGFQIQLQRPCLGANATIVGTDAAETITGTAAADVISAGGGNDKVTGLGAGDRVCGGDGKDKISGGAGADQLAGEGGKDTLKGGAGKDKLKGGAGKDVLRGGKGRDVLKGGAGRDNERQ